MKITYKILVPVFLLSLQAVFVSGCKNYQMGFITHPQIQSIAAGSFENKTKNPVAGTVLKAKVAEAVMRDGSVKLLNAGEADVVINGKIVDIRSKRIASIKSDKDDLSDYQAEYRGAFYRVYLEVSYEVVSPKLDGKVIISNRTVVGEGSYPSTPDLSIARGEGLKQAAGDAAKQIVASVTEAW